MIKKSLINDREEEVYQGVFPNKDYEDCYQLNKKKSKTIVEKLGSTAFRSLKNKYLAGFQNIEHSYLATLWSNNQIISH